MEKTDLTPEQSLLLISKTIEETKERFKEYGGVFVFWGTLTVIVFGSQLILSLLELYKFTMVPVYLFPAGAIITGIWAWKEYKKKNIPKNHHREHFTKHWLDNWNEPDDNGISLFGYSLEMPWARFLSFCLHLMIIVSGLSIKFKPLIIGGALANLIGLGSFFLDRDYHGFSLMLAAVVGMIIPGILLNIARRKDHV